MTKFVVPDFVGTKLFPFAVTYLANGWGVSVATINPELGAAMLALNADEQRNDRPANIRAYGRDMASGSWPLTHQAIAYNRRGFLFDGQNRLRAGIAAGVPFPSLVFFGAGDSEEMAVLDIGGVRTAADAARVMGLTASHKDVALVRQMCYSDTQGSKFTHAEIIRLLDRHGDAVAWVNAHFSDKTQLGIAPVRSAVGRAYYHCDLVRLARFVSIYLNEIGRDNCVVESIPATLSKYVLSTGGYRAAAQGYEIRGKALRSIEAYMNREPLTKLQHSPGHVAIYPLPQDPEAKGGAA